MRNERTFNSTDIAYIINHNGTLPDRSVTDIKYAGDKAHMSLLEWSMCDTGNEQENARRKRIMAEYGSENDKSPAKIRAFSHDYVTWHCSKCGYTWVKRLDNRTGAGRDCTECHKIAETSIGEQILYKMVEKAFGKDDAVLHKRLCGFEYDICIESLKLIIEFGGEYQHSRVGCAERDEIKRNLAAQQGYKVLTVIQGKGNTGIYYDKLISTADFYVCTGREYVKQYIKDNYNIEISSELSEEETISCLKATKYGVADELDEKIVALRKKGYTYKKIGLELGITADKVGARYRKMKRLCLA